MKKYSVVLPAYNEEKNISRVLKLLSSISRIGETVVVDDGSSDKTSKKCKNFRKVRLVVNKKNLGKTRSVIRGVRKSKYKNLVFFDADLIGVTRVDVERMLDEYESGADMVIMDKGSQSFIFREVVKTLPALSGVRVLSKDIFGNVKFKKTDRFELEIRINDYVLENELKVSITPAPKAHDSRKYKKYSFFKGLKLDVKQVRQISTIYGVLGVVLLIKKLRVFYRLKNG